MRSWRRAATSRSPTSALQPISSQTRQLPHMAADHNLWLVVGLVVGCVAESATGEHFTAAPLKESSVGLAGSLQAINSIRDFGVIGETRREVFGRSECAGYFRVAPVRPRPVGLGDDLRQRLRGGCGFAFRGGEGAVCFDIADGERGDKCGKEN